MQGSLWKSLLWPGLGMQHGQWVPLPGFLVKIGWNHCTSVFCYERTLSSSSSKHIEHLNEHRVVFFETCLCFLKRTWFEKVFWWIFGWIYWLIGFIFSLFLLSYLAVLLDVSKFPASTRLQGQRCLGPGHFELCLMAWEGSPGHKLLWMQGCQQRQGPAGGWLGLVSENDSLQRLWDLTPWITTVFSWRSLMIISCCCLFVGHLFS